MPQNRLIAWGGTNGLESHRHVHHHFVRAAQKMGWKSQVVPDHPDSRAFLHPGSIVIAADLYANHLGEAVPDVEYVIHNFNGDHPLVQTAKPENLLRLQVWTDDAFGTRWSDFRSYDREGRILFQPWGTDLFAEEFMDPIYNAYTNEVAFVGAVWGEKKDGFELGNIEMIENLKLLCADSGFKFKHLTQVSDTYAKNAVRYARLAPAFAGGWQVKHNYLPCRVFKNISYGVLGFTNVPALKTFLDLPGLEMNEMFEWAAKLKRNQYKEEVRRQQRRISHYSYRESLVAIKRALDLGKL